MYFEYWHLQKPPFDNVPDPSMYAECHTSMENAIAETLFAIEEGNECLAVIIGDVGLGKTLSLRIIIDSLSPEKYQLALITNPSISFVQLLNEIIGQLTESPCNEKKKAGLLEIFNKLLFQAADAGKKIVLLFDEANAIAPANLENLRLLTNMQDDRRNLFTLVLAGQIELARRLEDSRRANLFQRIGTYSRIEKMGSIDQIKAYLETRLRLAGATLPIFTENTYPLFWELSDQGVPRLINKIAKLSLKAGETYGLNQIDAQVVSQVGRQFERSTGSKISRGKAKKKKEAEVFSDTNKRIINQMPSIPIIAGNGEMELAEREPISSGVFTESLGNSWPEPTERLNDEPGINQNDSNEETLEGFQALIPEGGEFPDSSQFLPLTLPQTLEGEGLSPSTGIEEINEDFFRESDQRLMPVPEEGAFALNPGDIKSETISEETSSEAQFFSDINQPIIDQKPPNPIIWGNGDMESAGRETLSSEVFTESRGNSWTEPPERLNDETEINQNYSNEEVSEGIHPLIPGEGAFPLNPDDIKSEEIPEETFSQPRLLEDAEISSEGPGGIFEEFQIEKFKVRFHLPPQFVEQALSSNPEDRLKMAGQAAVQAIKKFIELTSSSPSDPVSIWSELRSTILRRLDSSESEMAA